MNLDRHGSLALAEKIVAGSQGWKGVDIAICPPSVYLHPVAQVVAGTTVGLGAQNVHFESSGAFTGEMSPAMAADVGCHYVILGHSERRSLFGETSHLVNQKTHAVLAAGLTPIVCVGESLAEREAGRTLDVIRDQFTGSLAGLSSEQAAGIVIAYEPVWAIGTGKVATPAQAEEVHRDLRNLLEKSYNQATADEVRIQYGGSVKPDNAAELLGQPNIDGALVGGASLAADSFLAIIAAAL